MLSQHLQVYIDSFCGQRHPPVKQPGPGFLGVFLLLISSIKVILYQTNLNKCRFIAILLPFFDRSPPDCSRQRFQFAFVLFKSRSCLFQELSVPCGSIALAGSCRYVNHPKTGYFGMAIFNLRCSFSFALGSIPYRCNVLILTFLVLMQSNATCFFSFSDCSEAYNLSRYPQWDTLYSQAAGQANSCLKSVKGSLSYMNEKSTVFGGYTV